jgi:hypothetical protein
MRRHSTKNPAPASPGFAIGRKHRQNIRRQGDRRSCTIEVNLDVTASPDIPLTNMEQRDDGILPGQVELARSLCRGVSGRSRRDCAGLNLSGVNFQPR